jgi:hypothetical protein
MNSPSARCASPLLSPFPMTDSEAGEDARGLLELGACLLCYRKCLPHDNLSPCCTFIITLQHTVQQVDKAFVSQHFIICIVTSSLLCGHMARDSCPIRLTARVHYALNIVKIALHYSHAGTGIYGQSVTISGIVKIILYCLYTTKSNIAVDYAAFLLCVRESRFQFWFRSWLS